ncbi:MAG: prepilin peptidase [Gemmataceae bacterium]
MTNPFFFPDPVFGWAFLGILGILLCIASYTDLKSLVLPKWLTITIFALGIIANIVRGVVLSLNDHEVWVLGQSGAFVGALDGLLFALAGFLAAFLLFFFLWIMGVCGGGDVKIAAALGAWIGWSLLLWVFGFTIVTVVVVVIGMMVWGTLTGKKYTVPKATSSPDGKKKSPTGFALPLAIACLLVLPWALRRDLQVGPEGSSNTRAQAAVSNQ